MTSETVRREIDLRPRRILFTIPHYFRPTESGFHGSEKGQVRKRIRCLTDCLSTLHQTFGLNQGLVFPPQRCVLRANAVTRAEIDVVVCTTGDSHLLGHLPPALLRQKSTSADPRLLGYECHAVLYDALGKFDFYCYMEDDLLLSDPLFFQKLMWFSSLAGDEALLQPNRFEQAIGTHANKLYTDGNIADSRISPQFQNIRDSRTITKQLMGMDLTFQRIDNPHSGCFFLNAKQMAEWAAAPYFLDRSQAFWGPLESAATLGIMRTFKVYKPARENAGFLEIKHLDNRYLGVRLDWPFAAAAFEHQ